MTGKDMFNRRNEKNGYVPAESVFFMKLENDVRKFMKLENDVRKKDAVIDGLTKMVDKLSRKILIMKRHAQRLKTQR